MTLRPICCMSTANANVRMGSVDGEKGDEITADEGGKKEQDENEDVADVGDESRRRRWGTSSSGGGGGGVRSMGCQR